MNTDAKYSLHCEECGSESIALIGATCEWSTARQSWIVEDMYDPTFICGECQHESDECEERTAEEVSA